MMLKWTREQIRIQSEFEESLTVLCLVVQDLNERDLNHIRTAVRCISSRTGKRYAEVVADCIDEILQGKSLRDTQVGSEINMIFVGGI